MKKTLIISNILLLFACVFLYLKADSFERFSKITHETLMKEFKHTEELKEHGRNLCSLCEEMNNDYEKLKIEYIKLQEASLKYIALVNEIYQERR